MHRRQRLNFSLVLVFTCISCPLLESCLYGQVAGNKEQRTLIHERDIQTTVTWRTFPRWAGGSLVGYENNLTEAPIIYAVDRGGYREDFLFTFKEAARISILQVAPSPTGEIAIVGTALTNDPRGTAFVARISADRQHQTVTRTWPYSAGAVTFSPDGTIWTIGVLKDEENTRAVADHVLRRFDSAGKLLGSAIQRIRRGISSDNASFLSASKDRVGWMTVTGEYIEYSLDGLEIARYDGPPGAGGPNLGGTSMALSEENDAIVGIQSKEPSRLLILNRSTRTWEPLTLATEHAEDIRPRVLGFDGRTLVTTAYLNGSLRRFTIR